MPPLVPNAHTFGKISIPDSESAALDSPTSRHGFSTPHDYKIPKLHPTRNPPFPPLRSVGHRHLRLDSSETRVSVTSSNLTSAIRSMGPKDSIYGLISWYEVSHQLDPQHTPSHHAILSRTDAPWVRPACSEVSRESKVTLKLTGIARWCWITQHALALRPETTFKVQFDHHSRRLATDSRLNIT
jgi:hypothetical protein